MGTSMYYSMGTIMYYYHGVQVELKAEASTALNLGFQIDIILSLYSWAHSGNMLGPILV